MKQRNAGIVSGFSLRHVSAFTQVAVLLISLLVPMLIVGRSSAAPQLTLRSAAIDKSYINATDVQFNMSYTMDNVAATKAGIMYQFCTNPLGACTLPTGMNVQTSNDHVAQASWPNNGTAFAAVSEGANVGDCTLNTNAYIICYSRDETVATGVTGGAVTHNFSGITAPSAVQTVYLRVFIYSDDDFGSGDLIQEGVVAAAFVDQLTVNGRVQERLDFCVAGIDDDDALPADVATCTALSDANVDIGIITNAAVAVSPVEPDAVNGADDDYGILMVNTNALNGVTVGYYPEDASSVSGGDTDQLKAFRVVPANCDASAASVVDQCFVSASNAGDGAVITAGTELFGVYVPCVDTTQGSTSNLSTGDDTYDGSDETITSAANCETEAFVSGTAELGWNITATADPLVSSTSVIDDEIIKLRFAATAAASTPSGSYTTVTTYIATPTF